MKVYVCGIAYRHEIGEAADGNRIYYTPRSFEKYSGCEGHGCGMVELELDMDNPVWIEPENHEVFTSSALSPEEAKKHLVEEFEQRIRALKTFLANLKKETS